MEEEGDRSGQKSAYFEGIPGVVWVKFLGHGLSEVKYRKKRWKPGRYGVDDDVAKSLDLIDPGVLHPVTSLWC